MAALKINENEQTPVHFVSIEPSHAFGQIDVFKCKQKVLIQNWPDKHGLLVLKLLALFSESCAFHQHPHAGL